MLAIIGIIIGTVMGLTGAGGALIAIPLFMQFQGMSLKEASVYSLVAVVIASLSNFYYQRKNAHLKLATLFVVFSAVGSFISTPYKNVISDLGIAVILSVIAIYSLYSVWIPSKKLSHNESRKIGIIKTASIGLILGVLTTFTGLGGGVLMLPVLLGLYRFAENEAVATSLVVVGLSSLISFLIQFSQGTSLGIRPDFIGLLISILATSYILKIIVSKISIRAAGYLRKIIFTVVVGIALATIF